VAGIVAYALVVAPMHRFSAFSGSVALALLMLPIIVRTSEEIFRTVPDTLREASLALGIPRWKTILRIVMKTASGGLVTGIMLAVARVGGEAAPLLFTAFSNSFWNLRPDQPIATLPVQLFNSPISLMRLNKSTGGGIVSVGAQRERRPSSIRRDEGLRWPTRS
jgi:phosphate transport system permease protein